MKKVQLILMLVFLSSVYSYGQAEYAWGQSFSGGISTFTPKDLKATKFGSIDLGIRIASTSWGRWKPGIIISNGVYENKDNFFVNGWKDNYYHNQIKTNSIDTTNLKFGVFKAGLTLEFALRKKALQPFIGIESGFINVSLKNKKDEEYEKLYKDGGFYAGPIAGIEYYIHSISIFMVFKYDFLLGLDTPSKLSSAHFIGLRYIFGKPENTRN